MSYVKPTIDENGVNIPSYEDILSHLITEFKEIYGSDIYLEEDSQDYQFLSSLALLYYDCCQAMLLTYGNISPTTAIGSSLDKLCALNGIVRKSDSFSVAPMFLTGTPGVELSYAQVKDMSGYLWQLDRNITFDENGELITTAACLTPGSIQAAPGTIVKIVTPTSGWFTATNTSAAVVGNEVEEDSDLRERRLESVSLPSVSPFGGLVSSVKTLNSVLRVRGYENDTGTASDAIPPHSIALVVEGGDAYEIAEKIYMKKTPGTATYGDVAVDVEGEFGVFNTIKFSRPEYVPCEVILSIQSLSGFTSNIVDQIKARIVDYLNGVLIGESLYISNMYLPILTVSGNSTQTFYIKSLIVNSENEQVIIGKFEALSCSIEDVSIIVN